LNTLTRTQLEQLSVESVRLYNWTVARDFIYQMYGDKAVTVHFDVHGESDDEGGLVYSIDNLIVRDEEDTELYPDTTLPFYQLSEVYTVMRTLTGEDGYSTYTWGTATFTGGDVIALFGELYFTANDKADWVMLEDISVEDADYDFRAQPVLSFEVTPI